MIEFKPRIWTCLGLSAIALASLGACQGEQGTTAANTQGAASATAGEGEGEGAKAVPPPAPPPSGASGETGEAGVSDAYADVPQGSKLGLRVAHVTGFLLIAQKSYEAGQMDEASVLVSQGLLEVFTPNVRELDEGAPGFEAALNAVVKAIDTKKPKAEVEAAIAAALKVANDATKTSKAAPQDIISGMTSISAGLYKGVVAPEGNDPTEYQHAYGAALSAKAAFDASKDDLTKKDPARTATLAKDLDALLALYPSVTLPEDNAKAASRAQLALSGIR
jgi:hypothetical protein